MRLIKYKRTVSIALFQFIPFIVFAADGDNLNNELSDKFVKIAILLFIPSMISLILGRLKKFKILEALGILGFAASIIILVVFKLLINTALTK